MISIIIPAHNEEVTIASTIEALLTSSTQLEIDLIVVCNGCSDNTVSIVESYGDKVTCLETGISSKTNALNMGDNVAKYFPRIYLDADVVLTAGSAEKLAMILQDDATLAAAPQMKMDYGTASWGV